ncbi:phage tail assembly chaperone G [Bacillus smithii]|uniref:phage tail assembly chaperone G n=1 Tax=Bacillus smithii TaxID=1479 RepID=UPI0030C95E11
MKPIKVRLYIDDKEKTFMAPFVPTRIVRTVLEMQTRMDFNNLKPDEMDELVNLICNVFKNQFTIDQFYDGLPADEFQQTMIKVLNAVSGRTNEEATDVVEEGTEKK